MSDETCDECGTYIEGEPQRERVDGFDYAFCSDDCAQAYDYEGDD